jgi:hypothetical protein
MNILGEHNVKMKNIIRERAIIAWTQTQKKLLRHTHMSKKN